MPLVRSVIAALLVVGFALPVSFARAEEVVGNRVPAATKHAKKKKATKKAKRGGKKSGGKAKRNAVAKRHRSHAPKAGSGAPSHTPPPTADDLPMPSVESTTEH